MTAPKRKRQADKGAKLDRLVCKWFKLTDPEFEPFAVSGLNLRHSALLTALTLAAGNLRRLVDAVQDPYAPGATETLRTAAGLLEDGDTSEAILEALWAAQTLGHAVAADVDPALYETERERARKQKKAIEFTPEERERHLRDMDKVLGGMFDRYLEPKPPLLTVAEEKQINRWSKMRIEEGMDPTEEIPDWMRVDVGDLHDLQLAIGSQIKRGLALLAASRYPLEPGNAEMLVDGSMVFFEPANYTSPEVDSDRAKACQDAEQAQDIACQIGWAISGKGKREQ